VNSFQDLSSTTTTTATHGSSGLSGGASTGWYRLTGSDAAAPFGDFGFTSHSTLSLVLAAAIQEDQQHQVRSCTWRSLCNVMFIITMLNCKSSCGMGNQFVVVDNLNGTTALHVDSGGERIRRASEEVRKGCLVVIAS